MAQSVMHMIPEVELPLRRLAFKDKFFWTIVSMALYIVCCQLPIYGVQKQNLDSADPLTWLRVVLASQPGTLMELGITPVICSSMLMQVAAGFRWIHVNFANKDDRELFQAMNKLCVMFNTFIVAVCFLLSGRYGDINELGVFFSLLIVSQLVVASLIVMLLDEMIQKGHGLGSGLTLFIVTNVATTIMWQTFSFSQVRTEHGDQYEGCIIAFFHLLVTKQNKVYALQQAFYRQNAPNLISLFASIIVFLAVVFAQRFRVEIPITSRKGRNFKQMYPINLFYTANIPIILQISSISALYMFSYFLYKQFGSNFMGKYAENAATGNMVQSGGLAYYFSPPKNFILTWDPLHTIFYVGYVLWICVFFAKLWIEIAGSSARDIARQLSEQDVTLEGGLRDDAMVRQLNRYIMPATSFGGFCIGALTVFADWMGALGTGTGIVLAVTIIYQYFEAFAKEKERGGDMSFF